MFSRFYKKRFLLKVLKQERGLVIYALLLMLLGTLLQLPIPFLTKYIIDNIIPQKNLKAINIIGISIIGFVLLKSLTILGEHYSLAKIRNRVLFKLRMLIFEKLLSLPVSYFYEYKTGYLVSRVSRDIEGVKGLLAETLVQGIENIMTFIVGVGATFYIHHKLALCSYAILPFYILAIKGFNNTLRKESYNLREYYANVEKVLTELIANIDILKIFTAEKWGEQKYAREAKIAVRQDFKLSMLSILASLSGQIIANMVPIILLWYGSYEIVNGRLTIGGLIAFNSFVGYLFGPASALVNINFRIQKAKSAILRLQEILNERHEGEGGNANVKIKNGFIEFKNVWFAYKNDYVLKNVNFKVNPGEFTAIVGRTGHGKTTITKLILRLYDIDRGEILIDDVNVKEIAIYSLRNQIGYVPQSSILFSGSIYENVKLGKKDAKPEEVIRALKMAGCDFVFRLKDGLYTEVGERGIGLSGGEIQRVCLARALIRDPKILILDEATSNLDERTEREILLNLLELKGKKTIIFITHRIGNVKLADRVLHIKNGEIVFDGPSYIYLKDMDSLPLEK